LTNEILELVKEVKIKILTLNEIALKPNLMIDEEYFDKMIQFENDLKNQGWEKRVEGLRMMKEQNKRIELLSKSVKIIDFFPTCKNLINEYSILN